ncbi:MAG: VOC family protein [Gammaproteobacteria bacterium]|nr:VOC family protein [Gammaproteobacteria bacterium]
MSTNPVGWFEIYVQDINRAKHFYETVFQTTLEKLDAPDPSLEMWAFPMNMEAAGAAGALCRMDGVPSGGNSTLVYFVSEDCALEEARVSEAGGRVERSKMSLGDYGFMTLVVDTEGNMIGVHSMQ